MKAHEIAMDARRNMKDRWSSNRMIEVEIDGKIIKTNLGADYPYWDGHGCRRYVSVRFGQTDDELFDDLVEKGYTYIRFVHTTTMVRGYHELHAFFK